jgi:hypothetical protein
LAGRAVPPKANGLLLKDGLALTFDFSQRWVIRTRLGPPGNNEILVDCRLKMRASHEDAVSKSSSNESASGPELNGRTTR